MIFWIASYPKSGNTWVRALLSSYYFSEDGFFNQRLLKKIGQFPEKNYFKDFDYNPRKIIDTSNYWIRAQEIINEDKNIKFFKTHNVLGSINNNRFTNKENTLGAIYIIRDPRNIITSIQNHYELDQEEALKFMLNEKKYIYNYHTKNDYGDFQFISSWEKNYQSWTKQKQFSIKLVKYEDLYKNTYETFKEIIEFIEKTIGTNKPFDKKRAKNSVNSTTFEKMKSIEKKKGFVESVLSKNDPNKIPFFHLGPNNDWRKIFNKEFHKKLNSIFKIILKELKYLD